MNGTVSDILFFLLTAILVALFFGWNFILKKLSFKYWFIHFKFFPKKISEKQQVCLSRNFSFYRKLKPYYQKSFDHRVAKFIKTYHFIPRQNFVLNDEIKTLIAGCYVKLTFGMNDFLASNFNKILIFPEYYFSKITGKNHIGEFNPQFNLIAFSWPDFLKGISNENDNYNLGIHEFSHAILELGIGSEMLSENDFREEHFTSFTNFGVGFRKIMLHFSSPHNFQLIKESAFFREYAFTDNYELLAVILEYFFESPKEFQLKFPRLFELVKEMINYNEVCFK